MSSPPVWRGSEAALGPPQAFANGGEDRVWAQSRGLRVCQLVVVYKAVCLCARLFWKIYFIENKPE